MNQPAGSPRRAHVRPMQGWWRRDPYFVRYMVREGTAVVVALYAGVLLVGLWCLAAGEPAWDRWLQALRNPWSIALHLVFLAGMLAHTVSWFQIMPKTMPMLFVGGRRVPAQTITRLGLAAAALAALGLWLWVWGLRP